MPLNMQDLQTIFQNEVEAIKFSFQTGLLELQYCDNHSGEKIEMKLRENRNFRFNMCYECHQCHNRVSILHNSIFTRTKLPIGTVLKIIYCWVYKYPCRMAEHECGVKNECITNFYSCLQNVCKLYNDTFFYSIGGEGLSVEIDETINARRKYNKGRISPQCWVFGGICRETKIAFAQIVPNRSSETLIPIIQERIMDGSTLYSDEWRSYDIIEKLNNNYHHYTVNHSKYFVDPDTRAHTQNIESFWNELKAPMKTSRGIPIELLDLYIQEVVFRHNTRLLEKEDPFLFMIEVISQNNFS